MAILALVLLGAFVPLLARASSRRPALWWAFGACAAVGYLAFLQFGARHYDQAVSFGDVAGAALVCAPWVGGWAYWGRRRAAAGARRSQSG